MRTTEKPYLEVFVVERQRLWNKDYPQENQCVCGHLYRRHFDSYEEMYPVGCKYCRCSTFVQDNGEGD